MKVKKFELMLRESSSCEWDEQHNVCFTDAATVFKFVNDEGLINLGSRPVEHLIVLALDVKGNLIGYNISSIGEIASTALSPRSILMFALECNAAACIICHNHPSQNVTPSDDDLIATRRLQDACKLMQIQLVDHLIVSSSSYTSLKTEGVIS